MLNMFLSITYATYTSNLEKFTPSFAIDNYYGTCDLKSRLSLKTTLDIPQLF